MVGQHIGKYRVTRQIGRGGMGTVYAALDEMLHRDVAIKVLNAGLDDPTVARRFRAEAVTVARLNHPGIATIYELLPHDGQWLMVMEFVRGETLEQTLTNEQALRVARAADIALQILAALAHAHGLGVVHRDLKPANIMIADGGGVKIMDFGIARVTGAEQLTSAGFMMGTPAYMAPEQVVGGAIDGRTDLYAVGIVLFQMVTGAMPFAGTTAVQLAQARVNEEPASLASIRPDLPAWLSQVIDIALARDPARRFQSATHFREAIRRGLAGVPIDGEITPPPASLTLGPTSPGALRVIKGGAVSVSGTATPPEAMAPTMAGPRATLRETSPAGTGVPRRRVSAAAIAGLSAAFLLVVLGGWWWTRPAVEPAAADVTATPDEAGGVDAGSPPGPSSEPVPDRPSAVGPAPAPETPVAPAAGSPRPSAVPATGAAAPPSGSGLPPAIAPAPPTVSPSSVPVAESASRMFRGVRAFVVAGRRADERPAVLAFADGVVTLFDDGGETVLTAMPFRQITAAAYTRDRNPRWYPTLAGPPIDVDMPGGLFRGTRHWLALQSRDAWMIVRMNDGDWRPITEAVTAVLGLQVDHLRP